MAHEDIGSGAVYRRVSDGLHERIRRGDWPAGSMLPGRRELAREYSVSLTTLERAVSLLLAEGVLRTDNRRGTFVADQAPAPREPTAAPPVVPSPALGSVAIIAPLYLGERGHLELNDYLVRALTETMEAMLADDGAVVRFYNRVPAAGRGVIALEDLFGQASEDGADAIVAIALGTAPAEIDRALAAWGGETPAVCITSTALRRPVPHVFYDNHSAGYQAAQHLLDQGHRELLVVAPFSASWVDERVEGVRAAIEHARLPAGCLVLDHAADRPWVNEEDPEALGFDAGRRLYAGGHVPRGAICLNDGVAFGVMRAAEEAGRAPGRDVAIVGFDNHPRAISLGLTTLRAPMEAMGQEAVRLLRGEAGGEQVGFQVRLRWRLIPRASSRVRIEA